LAAGAPFGALIPEPDLEDADPIQLPRVTLTGTVFQLERGTPAWEDDRPLYLRRVRTGEATFSLGAFDLHELRLPGDRLVGGLARATGVSPGMLARLAGPVSAA
jgi:hypothetical protein